MSDEWFKEGKDTRAVLKFFITLYKGLDKTTRKQLLKVSLENFVGKYTAWERLIEKAFSEGDSTRLNSIFSQCSNISWIGTYLSNINRLDNEQRVIAASSCGNFFGQLMSSIENGIASPKLKKVLQEDKKFKRKFMRIAKKIEGDIVYNVKLLRGLNSNFNLGYVSKRILKIRDNHYEEIDKIQADLLTIIANRLTG